MEETSKVISGLRSGKSFSIAERHQIIQEVLLYQSTRREIWKKYTGENQEHGNILKWMRQLGYVTDHSIGISNFVGNRNLMPKKKKIPEIGEESFEILQLKKRVLELESQLKDAEMKAIAFSTMVDIAENEFKIPIRKKLNTKPLKK